jgi:hypothetical protein
MASTSNLDGQSPPILSMEPISLPIEAAAKAVGLSRRYLDGAISNGDLVARKAGNKTLVDVADLRAWFNALPTAGKKAS